MVEGGAGAGGNTVDIRSAQDLAWENKLAKGFNTTDVPLEFCLLNAEIAEAFDAWRKGRPGVAEELADIAIYLLGLAEMIGADLQEAVEAKLSPLPSESYLQQRYGISRGTARKAVELLRSEGLVYTVPQRGTYVAEKAR